MSEKKRYRTVCKKLGVPTPDVSDREMEHIEFCENCRKMWPLYFFNGLQNTKTFKDICHEWTQLSEYSRWGLYKKLKKEEDKWIALSLKKRTPTAHQLFLRDQNFQKVASTFGEQIKLLSKNWLNLSNNEKSLYVQKSIQLKEIYKQSLNSLPVYKRKLLRQARTARKVATRLTRKKKAHNSFMLYLQEQWLSELKKQPENRLGYRSLMKSCSYQWKTLPDDIKQIYIMKSNRLNSYSKLDDQLIKTSQDPPKSPTNSVDLE